MSTSALARAAWREQMDRQQQDAGSNHPSAAEGQGQGDRQGHDQPPAQVVPAVAFLGLLLREIRAHPLRDPPHVRVVIGHRRDVGSGLLSDFLQPG
ncbi:hypothetical protein ACOJBM_16765 [Rhizobium beringeri]